MTNPFIVVTAVSVKDLVHVSAKPAANRWLQRVQQQFKEDRHRLKKAFLHRYPLARGSNRN
jgi:hypothetical protein